MDLIEHLEQEHDEIEEIFARYEADPEGTFPDLKEALDHHTAVEERVLYPAARSFAEAQTDHAINEHNKADGLVAALGEDVHNPDLLHHLRESIEHHVEEEETEFFPIIREHLSDERLTEMCEEAQRIE